MTFQRLSGRYRQEAVKYLIREEKDGHVRTRTFNLHGWFLSNAGSLRKVYLK